MQGTEHQAPGSQPLAPSSRLTRWLRFETGKGELLGGRSAADPEQAVEIDAAGGSGFGMERVRHIDPGADAAGVRETGNKGERERGAAGAFGSGEFGDGADGKAAGQAAGTERVIEGSDAGGGGGADDLWSWRERGRDAVGQGSFDLEAEQVGGRHGGTSSPYLRLWEGAAQGKKSTGIWLKSSQLKSG